MDFKLRPFALTDLKSLVKHANNQKIANNLTDKFPYPYSEENGKAFIEMTLSMDPISVMAITIEDQVVGGIGLHPQSDVFRKNAELGYWIAEPYWGKGIMPRAVLEMIDFGFQNLDITRIFARPFGSNTASQKVLEKAGFTLEARLDQTLIKNGIFEDEWIYAVRRP
jgi:[ribosomal protein S5]-alanine N-acetyltransferase